MTSAPTLRALCAALVLAGPCAQAQAQGRSTLVILPTLGAGTAIATGVNNAGQVVGGSFDSGTYRAFVWQAGTGMQRLGELGVPESVAYGINQQGRMVGFASRAFGSDTRSTAVMWQPDGSVRALLPELGGGFNHLALGLNDAGQAVGSGSLPGQFGSQALLWQADGNAAELPWLPGGTEASATAINNIGQAVGWSSSGQSQLRAALWSGGGVQDLGTLGGAQSEARAINASGLVVGWASSPANQGHAFLWRPGSGMQDLGHLGSGLSDAYGVSDAGQVVGWSQTGAGVSRGMIWTAGGGMRDLSTLTGAAFAATEARAINGHAQIVGGGAAPGGLSRAFLLTLHPDWTGGDGQWDDRTGQRWNWAGTGTAAATVGAMHDVLINPGGSATVQGGADARARSLQIGGTAGQIVTLDLAGGTTTVAQGATVDRGGVLRGSGRLQGDLRVEEAGRVQVGAAQQMQLAGAVQVLGAVDVQAASGTATLQVAGMMILADTGQLNLRNAEVLALGGVGNAGRINITGTSSVAGRVVNAVGARINVSGAAGEALFWDDLHNDGTVSVTTGSSASFFGHVTGAGSYSGAGLKHFAGGFAPGNSPARVTLQGPVHFEGGTLALEIGGLAAGTEHDQLVFVDAPVWLDGVRLDLAWWGGYLGQAGASYDLFDWNGGVNGSFASVALPALAAGLAWDTTDLYAGGVLGITAVPEPGGWALLSAGLALLGGLSRRRLGRMQAPASFNPQE